MNTQRMVLAAAICSALALPSQAQSPMPRTSSGSVAAHSVLAVGKIIGIDASQHLLTIEHQAIPRLEMAGMTMDFPVNDGIPISGLRIGQTIAFTLSPSGDGISISDVQPVNPSNATPIASPPHHQMKGHEMPGMKMSAPEKKVPHSHEPTPAS